MSRQDDFIPKGTWVFALLFLLLLIVIWGSVYYIVVSLGPTA